MLDDKMKTTISYSMITIICIIITIVSYQYDNTNFALVFGTISVMMMIMLFRHLIDTRNEEAVYKSSVRNILRTYDSVLVATDELPDLKKKNIVVVGQIYDLLDAQVEVKKPIYYHKYDDHTVFVLIDNDEACVSIIKLHPNVSCSYELALSEIKDEKNSSGIDRKILEELENTTIIRLDNDKEIKVSPVRKKEPIVLIPKNAMISKLSLALALEDDSKTSIRLDTITDINLEYDKKELVGLKITTKDEIYILKSPNEKKMERLMNEIKKKIN